VPVVTREPKRKNCFVCFRWLDSVQEYISKKHRNPVAKERAQKLMSYSLRLELEWLRSVMHMQKDA